MDSTRRANRLLDWLAAWRPRQPGELPRLAEMFGEQPPTEDMDLWLETIQGLHDRGVLKVHVLFGVFPSILQFTAEGRAETERRHARRADPRVRRPACREAFLQWAYEQGGESLLERQFLSSEYAYFEGDTFTGDDLAAALRSLARDDFVTGIGSFGDAGTVTRPRLTAKGERYVESGGTDRASAGTNVYIYGNNQAPLNVGNRDVTFSGAPSQDTRGRSAADGVVSADDLRRRHEDLLPDAGVTYRWEPSSMHPKSNLFAVIRNNSPRGYTGMAALELRGGGRQSVGSVELGARSSQKIWVGDSVMALPSAVLLELDLSDGVLCECDIAPTRSGRHYLLKFPMDAPPLALDLDHASPGQATRGNSAWS